MTTGKVRSRGQGVDSMPLNVHSNPSHPPHFTYWPVSEQVTRHARRNSADAVKVRDWRRAACSGLSPWDPTTWTLNSGRTRQESQPERRQGRSRRDWKPGRDCTCHGHFEMEEGDCEHRNEGFLDKALSGKPARKLMSPQGRELLAFPGGSGLTAHSSSWESSMVSRRRDEFWLRSSSHSNRDQREGWAELREGGGAWTSFWSIPSLCIFPLFMKELFVSFWETTLFWFTLCGLNGVQIFWANQNIPSFGSKSLAQIRPMRGRPGISLATSVLRTVGT